MLQAYRDLLDVSPHDKPYVWMTLQAAFVFYLVLGQFAALLLWRLAAPRRRGNAWFAAYLLIAQVLLLAAWPWLIGAWQLATPILLADLVAAFHLALVLAVVVLLALVLIGWPLRWTWTRNFWLRLGHLLVIEVVAGQAVVGIECPLKTLERMLRYLGGAESLHDLADASWLGRVSNELLYYQGDPLVFLTIYATVALLVLATWVFVPPRLPWTQEAANHETHEPHEKKTESRNE